MARTRRDTIAPMTAAENAASREPARWERVEGGWRCVEAPRAPWVPLGTPTTTGAVYDLPEPAPRPAPVHVPPTAEQLRDAPALCELNLLRERLGREPYSHELSETEIARRAGKIYEEHASYPITIVLPLCGCCGAVAARCPCHHRHVLPVDVQPSPALPCRCTPSLVSRAA